METSPSIKEIAGALCKFQNSVGIIAKTSDNPFFKSKYAGLPEILSAINAPLFENGLSFVQFPVDQNGLETLLMHTSGEWMKATYYMSPTKKPVKQFERYDKDGKGIGESKIISWEADPQSQGSCITYMRRYALGAILGLNTDEDDDGNAASGNLKKVAKPTAKAEGTWKPKPKETTQMDAATEVFSDNPLIGSIWTMDNGNYATCFKSPKSGKVCYAEYETQTCNRESFVKYLNDFEFDSLKREKLA